MTVLTSSENCPLRHKNRSNLIEKEGRNYKSTKQRVLT
jgi:hypothetical protein